jgi:hypothetical protein
LGLVNQAIFPFTQPAVAQLSGIVQTEGFSIPQLAVAELQLIVFIAPNIAPLQNIKRPFHDNNRTFRMFFGRFARFSDT